MRASNPGCHTSCSFLHGLVADPAIDSRLCVLVDSISFGKLFHGLHIAAVAMVAIEPPKTAMALGGSDSSRGVHATYGIAT